MLLPLLIQFSIQIPMVWQRSYDSHISWYILLTNKEGQHLK